MKLLCAVSRGIPVVDKKWLQACKKAKSFVGKYQLLLLRVLPIINCYLVPYPVLYINEAWCKYLPACYPHTKCVLLRCPFILGRPVYFCRLFKVHNERQTERETIRIFYGEVRRMILGNL